jgi:hypothetical protein
MKNVSKKITKLLLTFTIAGFVAVSPALAGMGGGSGGGMGGGSDRDSGGSMGGGSDRDSGSSMGDGSVSDSGDRMMTTEGQSYDLRSMPGISTGGLGSGDMTMEIEPVMFGNGRLEVKYYANTHTVGLGKYNLMELSTMEVDGKVYHPVEADRMSGHHAGGKIVFEIPERPDHFRMVIQGLPGVEKRLYEWN